MKFQQMAMKNIICMPHSAHLFTLLLEQHFDSCMTDQHTSKKLICKMATWKSEEDVAHDMDIVSGIQSSEDNKPYLRWHNEQDMGAQLACWKTDRDVAHDMDILSGIHTSERNIKPYLSWHNQQNMSAKGNETPESDHLTCTGSPEHHEEVDEKEWFPEREIVCQLPDSFGRGKKLEVLKAKFCRNKEMEIRQQLREVMGPGYSNEYIEKMYKKRVGLNSRETILPEQFQNSKEEPTDKNYKELDCQRASEVLQLTYSAENRKGKIVGLLKRNITFGLK